MNPMALYAVIAQHPDFPRSSRDGSVVRRRRHRRDARPVASRPIV